MAVESMSSAPRRARRSLRSQAGSSLIEVLVSTLLISIGLLGLVAMQAKAIQQAVQAGDRTRAAQLASEVVTQMWLQRSSTLAAGTLEAWQQRVADSARAGLPGGQGSVSTDAGGVTTITIDWRPVGLAASEPTRRYFTQVTIR